MTYNEWRDELKGYLLSVSEQERQRVLDYYAEAYADRREAGFSEREIIMDFGAPYDAAQRVLDKETTPTVAEDDFFDELPTNGKKSNPPVQKTPKNKSNSWVFPLICVLLCITFFGIAVGLVSATAALFCTPIAMFGEGVIRIVMGFVSALIYHRLPATLMNFGLGIVFIGLGTMLFPLFLKLVKFMWTLVRKLFTRVRAFLQERRNR